MATIQKFEDLEIWKKARLLSQKIYPLTSIKPISDDLRYKDQLIGSAGSIIDNIAGGFERGSRLEFINSLSISKGEVGEFKSQLYRGLNNTYFTEESFQDLYTLANELTKMITSFINYLNKASIKGQKLKTVDMAELQTENQKPQTPLVGIIMGSDSDLNIMKDAAEVLKDFDIAFELTIVSAHRTPKRMVEYANKAKDRGLKVIIAGAGGAAHLPGMIASITTLPVIGVPIKSSNSIDGWDSVLSILQMPNGVPVATVALNAAKNAGILAAQIIAAFDENISNKMKDYKNQLEASVLDKVQKVSEDWTNGFDKHL